MKSDFQRDADVSNWEVWWIVDFHLSLWHHHSEESDLQHGSDSHVLAVPFIFQSSSLLLNPGFKSGLSKFPVLFLGALIDYRLSR